MPTRYNLKRNQQLSWCVLVHLSAHLKCVQVDGSDILKDGHRDVNEGQKAISEVEQTH